MLEEEEREKMDKKQSNRQSSVPPKGNGTESKKDNGNGQKFPKQNRRRNHGNNSTYDQQPSSRKPTPQKSSRWVDKRPRQRGVHSTGRPEEMTSAERPEPEYGSVQSWGSKKNNLSHLLNFHFEPRDSRHGRGNSGNGGWRSGRGRSSKGRGPSYNKEHFLQANFQFIVQAGKDYQVHTADPDALVDWDFIEQVRITGSERTSCPICLYPPTVAKITRCGHIYCSACILHYLSLGDKHWRRCPICYDAVHQKDLKSVKVVEAKSYKVGDKVTMKLMKRMKGSTQAMPVGQWRDMQGKLFSYEDEVALQYSKLLVMTKEQIHEMVTEEKEILEVQLLEDGEDTLEGSFVKAAIELTKKRLVDLKIGTSVGAELSEQMSLLEVKEEPKAEQINLTAKRNVSYASAFSDEEEELQPEEVEDLHEDQRGNLTDDHYIGTNERKLSKSLSESSTEPSETDLPVGEVQEGQATGTVTDGLAAYGSGGTVAVCAEDGTIHEVPVTAAAEELSIPCGEGACPKQSSNYFYFYQVTDGQHMYLHSLNAQCLVREYGSLENCPETITAKIVELNGVTMNEELRKRIRYLGHLPVTCQFNVAELDLKPPVLSEDTLKDFSDKIERRKRQRQKKRREEKRFSQRIEERENKKFGIDRKAVFVKSEAANIQQDGSHSGTESSPYGSPPTLSSSLEVLATSPKSQASDDGGQASMSFAQMLRAGKAKPQDSAPRQGAPNVSSEKTLIKSGDSDDTDNEDRVPVPVFQESFGEAIQRALDNYKIQDTEVEVARQISTGKKKKKPKMVLFSTSVPRAK